MHVCRLPYNNFISCIHFQGSASILNIDNRSLFVGGFRQKEDLPPRASIKTGFTGAIQRVYYYARANLISSDSLIFAQYFFRK